MDLNADGHLDILSGSYSRMDKAMAGLFQVLLGKADGSFAAAAVVNGTDDQPLVIPSKGEDDIIESICTRPFAVDWDSDGDLDLVVGNFAGKFHLFSGAGKGRFSPTSEPLLADGKPLKLSGEHAMHGDPFVVDWDGDGDLDVLSGTSAGGVQWAQNTAGTGKPPALKPFAALIAAPQTMTNECRPNEVAAPAGSTRVWVADMNADGLLDVLVGDMITLVSPAAGLSEDDYLKRRKEWDTTFDALQKEAEQVGGQTDQTKIEAVFERMNAHHEKRAEFMIEDRTGFVWLYVQKKK